MEKTQADNFISLVENGQIIYAKEINDFLQSFGRDKKEVAEQVLKEWNTNGFVPIEDLKTDLLKAFLTQEKNNDTLQAQKSDILERLSKSSVKHDPLTGFYAKKHTALLTGLADLYAQTTDDTAFRIDGDYSNMGGTNEFFKEELQRQDQKGKRKYDGFEQTDTLVSVTAGLSYMTYLKAVKQYPKAHLHAVRSGGDEIRFILTGMPADAVKKAFEKADETVKNAISDNGLQTAANPKDKKRRGFGYADAMTSLKRDDGYDFRTVSADLDKEISAKKQTQAIPNLIKAAYMNLDAEGIDKADKAFAALLNQSRTALGEAGYSDKEIDAAVLDQRLEYVQMKIALKKEAEKENARRANEAGKPYRSSSLAFLDSVKNSNNYKVYEAIKRSRSDSEFTVEYEKDDQFKDSYQILEKNLIATFEKDNLNKSDMDLILGAAKDCRAIDPATGVRMASELEKDTERYMRDAQLFAQKHDGVSESDTPYLVHVEFGNLAGINNLSHEHGDAALRHYGDMMKKVFAEENLSALAHGIYSEGGGKFKLLLPPAYETVGADGKPEVKTVNESVINRLMKKLEKNVGVEVNNVPLEKYFSDRGVVTNIANEQSFTSDMKMGDIPNPKRSYEKGVTFFAKTRQLTNNEKVSVKAQISTLSNDAEAQIQAGRSKSLRQVVKGSERKEAVSNEKTNKRAKEMAYLPKKETTSLSAAVAHRLAKQKGR